jgi:2-succinyl-6-hydroxy-2,4-cyclohexadiene-1-carboxylate synthase
MKIQPVAFAAFFFMPLAIQAQESKVLEVNGATISYEVSGSGPAVVLLHGWAHSMETWHFLFPFLSEEYTAIRLNRRGFASSTGHPDTSVDPLDLRTLLDTLRIQHAVVVGHSQGANSALRFALEFPERLSGLVLFGSGPPAGLGLPWSGPDRMPQGHARVAREDGMEAWLMLWAGHPINNGFVEGTEGAEIGRATVAEYDGRDLINPQPSANATPAPDIGSLGEIAVPTLVIHGELEMPYFQVAGEVLAYGIPTADRVVVDGGGHSVHLQQPERFNAEILRFLRSVYP